MLGEQLGQRAERPAGLGVAGTVMETSAGNVHGAEQGVEPDPGQALARPNPPAVRATPVPGDKISGLISGLGREQALLGGPQHLLRFRQRQAERLQPIGSLGQFKNLVVGDDDPVITNNLQPHRDLHRRLRH